MAELLMLFLILCALCGIERGLSRLNTTLREFNRKWPTIETQRNMLERTGTKV